MCQCGVPCCYCELEGLYSFWEGEEREKQSKGCEFWGKKIVMPINNRNWEVRCYQKQEGREAKGESS